MVFTIKIIYTLLFSLVIYLVRLAITSDTPAGWRVVVALVAAVTSILLLSHYSQHPALLPAKEVRILLILDAGLVIYYVLNGFVLKQAANQQPKDNLEKPFFKAAFNIGELLRRNAMFFLIYLCQILTIWKPVQTYF